MHADSPASRSAESVGAGFSDALLLNARHLTLAAIEAAAARIGPGTSEDEGRVIVTEELHRLGSEKLWHAPQVRFGRNTLRAFGERGEPGVTLATNDIYFLDLGPVFAGHEGDVGRTFAVGQDPDQRRVAADAAAIWRLTRDRWFTTGDSGARLYAYATELAQARGWVLSLHEANGHRIADFPHAARQRGAVEPLEFRPAPARWILEIQLRHPTREFGAFYEDLLV
jgi:Xaa-Pro aminopeptidase